VVTQVDQTEGVFGTLLAELRGQAAQVVSATKGAVEHERKLGRMNVTDERMSWNEHYAAFLS
jgi:hypothetical protein